MKDREQEAKKAKQALQVSSGKSLALRLRSIRIRNKIFLALSIITISIFLTFLVIHLKAQDESIQEILELNLQCAETTFQNLEERDINALSSALEVIIQDRTLKNIYLKQNREELFAYSQPLFQKLKKKHGITHWYFIQPNGQVFLRLHDKDIYSDQIDRITFRKAKSTKNVASGIELGKTAFALRAVSPYYSDGKLIGYVELGEEIDRFSKILKSETGDEFIIIGQKDHLDREDWSSARKIAGLRDNWNDMENYLVLNSTTGDKRALKPFTEKDMELAGKTSVIFRKAKVGAKTLALGGFPLSEASGKQVGTVLCLIDITKQTALFRTANIYALAISIALLIIAFLLSAIIARSISKPLQVLTETAVQIENGDLSKRASVNSWDEIGLLAVTFNEMTVKLQESYKHLENKVEEKTKELSKSLQKYKTQNKELEETRKAMLNLLEDLREAKKIVEQDKINLEERQEELQKVNKELDNFTYTASHDLRAPLRAISSFTSFLEEDFLDKLDEEGRDYLAEIRKGTDRMSELMEDLLTLSRISRLKNPLEKVNINDLLNSIKERIELDIKEQKASLEIQESMPIIECDRIKIGQVFLNLINNAIKFSSKKNREHPKIEIGYLDKNSFYEFFVKDNGIGIDPRYHEQIFGIFKRLHTNTEYEGTGAGLSIVRRAINDHGGHIWVESKLGEGATFRFTIPKNMKNKKGGARKNSDKDAKVTVPAYRGDILVK